MTYRVEFAGDHSMAPERDGRGVALRLYRDEDYLQYFVVPVSGIRLRSIEPAPGPGFIAAIAELAADEIQSMATHDWRASADAAKRQEAWYLEVDLDAAEKRGRSDPTKLAEGHTIRTF